jgi:hypothetical protein
MGHLEQRARYKNDERFRRLVDILFGMIAHADYSPQDLHQASELALAEWYEERLGPIPDE